MMLSTLAPIMLAASTNDMSLIHLYAIPGRPMPTYRSASKLGDLEVVVDTGANNSLLQVDSEYLPVNVQFIDGKFVFFDEENGGEVLYSRTRRLLLGLDYLRDRVVRFQIDTDEVWISAGTPQSNESVRMKRQYRIMNSGERPTFRSYVYSTGTKRPPSRTVVVKELPFAIQNEMIVLIQSNPRFSAALDTGLHGVVVTDNWLEAEQFLLDEKSRTVTPFFEFPSRSVIALGSPNLGGYRLTPYVTAVPSVPLFGNLNCFVGLDALTTTSLTVDFPQRKIRFIPLTRQDELLAILSRWLRIDLRASQSGVIWRSQDEISGQVTEQEVYAVGSTTVSELVRIAEKNGAIASLQTIRSTLPLWGVDLTVWSHNGLSTKKIVRANNLFPKN